MFSVVERVDGPYPESASDYTPVADISNVAETPRKDDILVIDGIEYLVESIYRNYNENTVTVVVENLSAMKMEW